MSEAVSGKQANLFCENEENSFVKNFDRDYKRLIEHNACLYREEIGDELCVLGGEPKFVNKR